MKRKMDIQIATFRFLSWQLQGLLLAVLFAACLTAPLGRAQAPARFVGTITAVNGTTLTIKTDAGQAYEVQIPSGAAIKRIAPGQKDLSTAETIEFSDLAVGDRALVKLDPDASAGMAQAQQIIAVKQSDLAEKQQKEQEEWQRNGVGGLVKSIDPGTGVIQLTTGAGASLKTIAVHTTPATRLMRYAPASVSFDAAKPAPLDAIRTGDQLRARGTKAADGMSIDAVEVVSGSFRNLSGILSSVDAAASTVSLKDLATKKQVIIHITPEAQMRRLPERMATMLAARLKGGSGGGARSGAAGGEGGQRGGGGQYGGAQGGNGSQAGGAQAGGGQGSGGPGSGGQGSGGQGGGQWSGGGGDPQQMLNRAPGIQIADLKKGDAVMLVATDGSTDVTAITLVAGVEPLLEAPEASNLLSNWSMGGGSGAADAASQ